MKKNIFFLNKHIKKKRIFFAKNIFDTCSHLPVQPNFRQQFAQLGGNCTVAPFAYEQVSSWRQCHSVRTLYEQIGLANFLLSLSVSRAERNSCVTVGSVALRFAFASTSTRDTLVSVSPTVEEKKNRKLAEPCLSVQRFLPR